MNVKQVGNFYIVEQNGKYYLTTIDFSFDGCEENETVSGNVISEEVYNLLYSNTNIDTNIPSEVSDIVIKEYHSFDELPSNRRWYFKLDETLDNQILNNKHEYEKIYNDDEISIYITTLYDGVPYLSIAEDLFLDLEESYKSIVKKVNFIKDYIENKGYDACENFLYNLESDLIV